MERVRDARTYTAPMPQARRRRQTDRSPRSHAQRLKPAVARGFPPVIGEGARVLVLGSLPGRASLEAQQYYAQPQNAFWRIMGALVGAGPELGYRQRLARLKSSSLALWDVLAAARREGSLDAAIIRETAIVNDFASLFERHHCIELVCFNGRTAEELFRRRVLPSLPARFADIALHALPSTSPAHAGMPFALKLERWSLVLTPRDIPELVQ
jgi:hypoxanthine-DNA glycosylase